MALTIRDAESSYLEGLTAVQEWQAEFMKQWFGPEIDLALIQFWARLDPVMKTYLQGAAPQAYQQVEQAVQAAKEKYQNGSI